MKQEISKLRDIESLKRDIILNGDISALSSQEQVDYVIKMSESLGLNPLTQPIQLIKFQGKTIPYFRKDATDQLRYNNGVSINKIEKTIINDSIFEVTVYASLPNGKSDSDIGVVSIKGLYGDALCNAMMKAVTKAKRRTTLSLCGLGILDESELDTMQGHEKVDLYSKKNDRNLFVENNESKVISIAHKEEEPKRSIKEDYDIINACKDLDELKAVFKEMSKYWGKVDHKILSKIVDAKDHKKDAIIESQMEDIPL